jgi:single-strand DNA-binding protein
MAMEINHITVSGNVTRDPELRFTQAGRAVASFGVAVNRRWQNRQTQEWEEQVSFFDVTCWAQLAENVAESLNKGSRVVVSGRLQQRSYEDREGNKRNAVEIVADDVAASLSFATAEITRTERRSDGGSGGGGGTGGGGGGGRPRPARNDEYDADEEPF